MPTSEALPETPQHEPSPTPDERRACAARGGKIEPVCMLGKPTCVIRYRDAGKRCSDKADCTGDCLYDGPDPAPAKATGKCQMTSDPCGCRAAVLAGQVQPGLCVD
jgi:hypothetical protein